MELVMLFLSIGAGVLMGVGSLNLRGDRLTSTRSLFVTGIVLLLLDVWVFLVHNGIFFN